MIGDTPPRPTTDQLAALDAYQVWTDTTWKHPTGSTAGRIHAALALPEEGGEAAGVIKRAVRGDPGFVPAGDGCVPFYPFHSGAAVTGRLEMIASTPALRERLRGELGDALYQVARLAREFGIPLSEVAQANIHKLEARLLEGKITGTGEVR